VRAVSTDVAPESALAVDTDAVWRAIRARHPRLREALPADARVTALYRGERYEFRSRLDLIAQIVRLAWASDAFLAQVLYRVKARLQARGVPIIPRLCHRLSMMLAQVSIGDPVIMAPGVYIIHGQFVADGLVEIGPGAVIAPWVTIGLRAGDVRGATLEANVSIGTGAKVVGPVHIGAGAQVGANAVVVDDVPAGATVVGAPARPRNTKDTSRS
jgi:serine O-acetyltransferase